MLSKQDLANIAYLAATDVKEIVTADRHILASTRRPLTVTAWQDENYDLIIASSDGNYLPPGHAEANIVQANNGILKGGTTVSFTWDAILGDVRGIRSSCPRCREILQTHGAVDGYYTGLKPQFDIPEGWKGGWDRNRNIFLFEDIYDNTVSTSRPPLPSNPPICLLVGLKSFPAFGRHSITLSQKTNLLHGGGRPLQKSHSQRRRQAIKRLVL